MILQIIIPVFALLSLATAFNQRIYTYHNTPYHGMEIPDYNVSMPVDHFNSSDMRRFNNRYWVNDTYYRPGGPVILFDLGEIGISPWMVADMLGEWNGSLSATMRIAKALGGVAILWEHRYYGYSHPFALSTDNGASSPSAASGIPLGGAAEYKYLTTEQALEDVVYFAKNHFNKTQLGPGNTVLSGLNATQFLDPYHTPWIWVGGSYSGIRGAWMRLRNPEVFYAVWSSSAPVQLQPDGWAYFNALYRALPRNCTADMHSVARYVDEILSSDNHSAILDLKISVFSALSSGLLHNVSLVESITETFVAVNMFQMILQSIQSYGVSRTAQVFCDFMESFQAESYLSNSSLTSSDPAVRNTVWMYNQGNSTPTADGIVVHSGRIDVGLAAYLYGLVKYIKYASALTSSVGDPGSHQRISLSEDNHSWQWQVLSEFGLLPNINITSPLSLGSKFLGYNYTLKQYQSSFATFPVQDIPSKPDMKYLSRFGGWNMQPSNIMFTNGEFDPWRAYSLMSPEQDTLGAPIRSVTQNIPECGKPASSETTVFGLLYEGAVHAEDLLLRPGEPTGYTDTTNPPIKRGLDLFLKAYDKWLPCFEASRTDSVRSL
jgi:hypothetical protein